MTEKRNGRPISKEIRLSDVGVLVPDYEAHVYQVSVEVKVVQMYEIESLKLEARDSSPFSISFI